MQQEISLYLDLEHGRKADLATTALAALAFDKAIKEITFLIDPTASVRVELESGTEGSLSLNSIINAVKLDEVSLKAIAWSVITFFVCETASYTYEKILDSLISEPEIHQKMTQEEVESLARSISTIIESKQTEKQIGKIYQELQRDDAVIGVGVSPKHNRKPIEIVPRAEFQKRGRVIEESEATGQRSEKTVQTLTLVSPVLVRGSNRKWKFRIGKLEFGAQVKDEDFLTRVLSGREPIAMAEGIIMKVLLNTKEEKKDGVWQIKERSIEEVIGITSSSEQTVMPF